MAIVALVITMVILEIMKMIIINYDGGDYEEFFRKVTLTSYCINKE